MRVCCTRPLLPEDLPLPGKPFSNGHLNEIENEILLSGSGLEHLLCQTCEMPLVIRNQYVVEAELGQGGFGRTFRAIDLFSAGLNLSEKRRCVLKQFAPSNPLSTDGLGKAVDLFNREAQVLQDLEGEKIAVPRFYSFIVLKAPPDPRHSLKSQQYFYIAQEYIRGKDLEQERLTRLREGQPYSDKEIHDLLGQILRLLAIVHKRAFHRDIKPSNLIRSIYSHQLYLIDFGAVRDVLPEVEGALGQGSTMIYSVGFAPPEQERDGQVNETSDSYALAATCIHLMTNPSTPDLLRLWCRNGTWRNFRKDISPGLANLLDRMLSLEVSDRYPTAAVALDALEALPPIDPVEPPPVVGTLPVVEPPPKLAWFEQASQAIGRLLIASSKWFKLATLAIAGLLLVLSLAWLLGQGKPAPQGGANSNSFTSIEHVSFGDRLLITEAVLRQQPDRVNAPEFSAFLAAKQAGIAAFAKLNYSNAIQNLEAARQQNKSDPETLIYLNNARILAAQKPAFQLAVSVPIGRAIGIAEEMLRGVAQAQDTINLKGGIAGKLAEVVIVDDANNPQRVASLAASIAADSPVLGVIGSNNGEASASAANVYQAQKLVMVSPTTFTSIPEIEDIVPENRGKFSDPKTGYIFRTAPASDVMSEWLLAAINTLPQPQIAICAASQSPDNNVFAKDFRNVLSKNNITIAEAACDFSQDPFDAAAAFDRIEQAGANAIFMTPTINNFKPAIALARVNQNRLPLFGSPSMYTGEIARQGGKDMAGLTLPAPWHPTTYRNNRFAAEAESPQYWGATVNWRSASAYDATNAIFSGLQQAADRGVTDWRTALQPIMKASSFAAIGSGADVRFLPTGDRDPGNLAPVLLRLELQGTDYQFVPLQFSN